MIAPKQLISCSLLTFRTKKYKFLDDQLIQATPSHTLVSGHLPAWYSESLIYEDYYYFYRCLRACDIVARYKGTVLQSNQFW